jgi:hypothetical protein
MAVSLLSRRRRGQGRVTRGGPEAISHETHEIHDSRVGVGARLRPLEHDGAERTTREDGRRAGACNCSKRSWLMRTPASCSSNRRPPPAPQQNPRDLWRTAPDGGPGAAKQPGARRCRRIASKVARIVEAHNPAHARREGVDQPGSEAAACMTSPSNPNARSRGRVSSGSAGSAVRIRRAPAWWKLSRFAAASSWKDLVSRPLRRVPCTAPSPARRRSRRATAAPVRARAAPSGNRGRTTPRTRAREGTDAGPGRTSRSPPMKRMPRAVPPAIPRCCHAARGCCTRTRGTRAPRRSKRGRAAPR